MRSRLVLAAAVVALLAGAPCAAQTPAGSAFTYQGELEDAGTPVNCVADLRFSLWDALSGGTQQCSTRQVLGVNIVQGRFTVSLDFRSEEHTSELQSHSFISYAV